MIFFPLSTFAVFLSIHLGPFLSEILNLITKTFLEIQITMNLFCRVLQTEKTNTTRLLPGNMNYF